MENQTQQTDKNNVYLTLHAYKKKKIDCLLCNHKRAEGRGRYQLIFILY